MLSSSQPSLARLFVLPSPTLARADDLTLARALRAMDPRATSVLWDRFSPLVRRMLRRTLGPTIEVETLLQKVFLRILKQVGHLSLSAQLKPFVVAVTVRILSGELRRSRLRRLLGLRSPPQGATSGLGDAATRAALSALYRILEDLDVEACLTFTLFHFEGLHIGELAFAMDTSLSISARRLARANAHVQAAVTCNAAFLAYATAASLTDGP